jgi:acyl carrier protein phosphodiesterase
MNFLAHTGLALDAASTWACSAEEIEGLLAGAIIGDFVKGRIPQAWPDPLRAGVALHRKIDALSNLHPGIQQTCRTYPDNLRRYAPIFLDLLADHSLARAWPDYYDRNISHVTSACYLATAGYGNAHDVLSNNAARFLAYMQDVDLLANYDDWGHIQQGLRSVVRRLKRDVDVAQVLALCEERIDETDLLLNQLYPDLRAAFGEWSAFEAIAAR